VIRRLHQLDTTTVDEQDVSGLAKGRIQTIFHRLPDGQEFQWFRLCIFYLRTSKIFSEVLCTLDRWQITSLQSLLLYHIRQLRCIRLYLDSSAPVCTIATSIVHTKLDYCNPSYHKSQLSRLQQIQNSLARSVVKVPKSCHIIPILRSLHWRKTTERIEHKLFFLTYTKFSHNYPTSIPS